MAESKQAKKNDGRDAKPKLRFLHRELKFGPTRAMMAGEIKYGAWNFLKGHGLLQLLDAMERHIQAIRDGEWTDPDTTEYLGKEVTHLDCIGANLNMIYWQKDNGTLKDDRIYLENKHDKD